MTNIKHVDCFDAPTACHDGLRVEWCSTDIGVSVAVVERRAKKLVATHMELTVPATGEHHGKLQRTASLLEALCNYFNASGDFDEFDRLSILFHEFIDRVEFPVTSDPLVLMEKVQRLAYYPEGARVFKVFDGELAEVIDQDAFVADLEEAGITDPYGFADP